jgi:bacteriophage N4 adsorption protein B
VSVWFDFLRGFLVVAAIGFILSGLDDLFVDGYYYWRRAWRRLFVQKKYSRLTEDDLRRTPEQPIAVMIACWQEQAVIGKMLENALKWIDYRDYDLFVGTYPNDEATLLAVAAVQEQHPRVHRIVCPHDGPTSKGDCLNWVFEGIRLHEKQHGGGRQFAVYAIHDSEDIIHPLSLKLYNHLIPKVHMVQLPVVPLEMSWRHMTAGTYLDEFAEFHTKDLLVRERVSGMIPSAGVGTALSREAVQLMAASRKNQLFSVDTVTEDYDFGFRLKALNLKSILLQFAIERTQVVRTGFLRRREGLRRIKELVATREFFPSRFQDAVRQKQRWIFGIVFQGWKQIGWIGGARMRYMIWRDRKALFTNVINIVGYILLVLYAGTFVVVWVRPSLARPALPTLVPAGSWIWALVVVATVLMVHRGIQRVVAVRRVAGWSQAALSLPRVVWGNLINFTAVWGATRQFLAWQRTGGRVAWAKTSHAFPTEAHLVEFRRKLGDLLLENRLLSLAHLQHAMQVQQQGGGGDRLGDVLMRLGYIEEDDLTPVLAGQLRVELRRVDARAIPPTVAALVPESAAREHQMLPIGIETGTVVIAAVDPGSRPMAAWIEHHLDRPFRLVMTSRKNLREEIARLFGRQRVMLGELLVQAGVITAEQLELALEEQRASGRKLGEILEAFGVISRAQLEQKIREQAA